MYFRRLFESLLNFRSGASRGSPSKVTKSNAAAPPLPSRGPNEGGSATQPLRSRGSPSKGTGSKRAASPLPSQGAHIRAELLRNPCVLGGPDHRGQNQKWLLDGFFRCGLQSKSVLRLRFEKEFMDPPPPCSCPEIATLKACKLDAHIHEICGKQLQLTTNNC